MHDDFNWVYLCCTWLYIVVVPYNIVVVPYNGLYHDSLPYGVYSKNIHTSNKLMVIFMLIGYKHYVLISSTHIPDIWKMRHYDFKRKIEILFIKPLAEIIADKVGYEVLET